MYEVSKEMKLGGGGSVNVKAKCLFMRKSQVCECEINRVSKFLNRRGEGCVSESE